MEAPTQAAPAVTSLGGLASIDERILRFARSNGHDPRAELAVARFSALGEHGGIWLALGACGWMLDSSQRRRWRRATGTVARVYALNTLIKLLVRRRRPNLPDLPPLTSTPTQLSFPSAHASTSFAGASGFARLGLARTPLYILAAGLSASRLYLGVHHPSDLVGGALLGSLLAARRAG